MKNCLTCKHEPDWFHNLGKCKGVAEEAATPLIKLSDDIFGVLGRITDCDTWVPKPEDAAGIKYHATGPNKENKYIGYVSIDGLPSLCTVQMYSTPDEAITAIRELIKIDKKLKADFLPPLAP